MKILAQHGFGPKDKLSRGLSEELISGVILSPRYSNREKMQKQIEELTRLNGQVLMDPELYAIQFIAHPSSNLGNLEKWEYFKAPRRSTLISGMAIPDLIRESLKTQSELGLKEWIAPNVYIQAADSIEAAISLNFISQTKEVASQVGEMPVFATLAIDGMAVMERTDFQDIFDALTAIETPPDGYYIVMGCQGNTNSSSMIRSDVYDSRVIAGWMYMNHVLSINSSRVINGYCHLLSPLLGICGAEAAASGWFSGLRQFSINRYIGNAKGGKYPLIRYVSNPLFARIKQTDLLAFKKVLPSIVNELRLDTSFLSEEPTRTEEALQSWEALSAQCKTHCSGNLKDDLENYDAYLVNALIKWSRLYQAGFPQGNQANTERIEAIREGIEIFKEWAELA